MGASRDVVEPTIPLTPTKSERGEAGQGKVRVKLDAESVNKTYSQTCVTNEQNAECDEASGGPVAQGS
jgi:hypothetical protein